MISDINKLKDKIIYGDSLEILKKLPSESIDCVVTSPPYWNLRDYSTARWIEGDPNCDHVKNSKATKVFGNPEFNKGRPSREETKTADYYYKDVCEKCGAIKEDKQLGQEQTIQEYIDNLCNIFDEVKRVLKKRGTCWVNLGDTYSSISGGMSKGYYGKNPALGDVVKQPKTELPDKCLCQIPSRFAIEMTNRGWTLRNEIVWQKSNQMPQSVKDRFTVDFEKVFFFVKNRNYHFNQILEEATGYDGRKDLDYHGGNKDIALGKHKRWRKYGEVKDGVAGTGLRVHKGFVNHSGYSNIENPFVRNKRCVWTIPTKSFKEAHFATYPEALIEPMIQAGCPEEGIVLDPFMGSGTTGLVAKKQNKYYIGIDLNPEYIKIAKKRIKSYVINNNKLF